MALLWSKKSKAEKNYGEETRKAKIVGVKTAKGAEVSKSRGPDRAKQSGASSAGSEKTTAPRAVVVPSGHFDDTAGAIIRPHITEKSGLLSQSGVYTFQITENANKNAVSKAIKTLYKVVPIKVAVANLPARKVFVKGRWGSVSGVRKAMVTLKKGDKIDFV